MKGEGDGWPRGSNEEKRRRGSRMVMTSEDGERYFAFSFAPLREDGPCNTPQGKGSTVINLRG